MASMEEGEDWAQPTPKASGKKKVKKSEDDWGGEDEWETEGASGDQGAFGEEDFGDDSNLTARGTKADGEKKAKKAKGDDDWGDGDEGWGEDGEGWDEKDEAPVEEEDDLTQPALTRASSYVVMAPAKLTQRVEVTVNQTAELLALPPSEASCMLRHFGWKDEKLKQEYWSDPAKVRRDVGLTVAPAETKQPQTVQCETAYCDVVPVTEAARLNCGHWFCNNCWTGYLTSKINHGQECIFATCMGMKCKLNHPHKFGCACNEKVPEAMFERFVKDATLIGKYRRWILNSFVEGQKNKIKWCPRPGCENAVLYPTGGTKDITCACGFQFCFSCGTMAHNPAPCDLVKRWLEQERSDDATQIWLAARTKECPKCQVRIEKNKACNHMNCTKCGHHFCWLCKGPWSTHGSSTGGFYVCNKYNEDTAKGALSEEESKMIKNTRSLQKYTYYYKRFKSMQDGIAITKKLGEKIEQKAKDEDLQRFSFLLDAVEKLIQARHVLQWTYCMAYYMRSSGNKQLFEYQQDMLTGATESLQDILENKPTIDELMDSRKEIINKTSSIDKFRSEMVKQVEKGDFEEMLLSSADDVAERWACGYCKRENPKDAAWCTSSACGACRLHGEPDCKACKKAEAASAAARR